MIRPYHPLTAILKQEVILDPKKAFQLVSEDYHNRFGLRWLKPFGFNNTYAITVRAQDAQKQGWTLISDLHNAASGLRAGFTAEFSERPDGYQGLAKVYDLRFSSIRDLDPSFMYDAIAKGEVDVICAFATVGRIAAYNLTPLDDDLNFFPPYHAAPVVREETLKKHPQSGDVLLLLGGVLDNTVMQRLNFEVDEKKMSPAEVAKAFLKAKGLIPS